MPQKTNPWGVLTVMKDWLCEQHMDDILGAMDALSNEELMASILSIRSIKPTPVAKVLIQSSTVKDKIWEVICGNSLAHHAILGINAYSNNYNKDWIMGQILNKDMCFRIGQAFQETPFWKTKIPEIREQMRNLKKVDGVMQT